MLNWIKHNRKLQNAGKMKAERVVVFIRNNMAFLYYKLNFVSFCWISGAIVLSLLP